MTLCAKKTHGVNGRNHVVNGSHLPLTEEETVIVLANLLDNAIAACEDMLRERERAVIHVRMVYENEQLTLSVKNPVLQPVLIENGVVIHKHKDGHGIGLTNVKDVAE